MGGAVDGARRGRRARIALDFAAHGGSARPHRFSGAAHSTLRTRVRRLARLLPNYLRFTIMKTWMCLICGWIYDEAAGAPEEGIAAGTLWADVPMNWTCPECGARKEDFEMIEV